MITVKCDYCGKKIKSTNEQVNLDFNAYDYDFTVNAIAGNAQCFAKTYTVK